jgi:hypothetical protein
MELKNLSIEKGVKVKGHGLIYRFFFFFFNRRYNPWWVLAI